MDGYLSFQQTLPNQLVNCPRSGCSGMVALVGQLLDESLCKDDPMPVAGVRCPKPGFVGHALQDCGQVAGGLFD
jgi:hypothetical protein